MPSIRPRAKLDRITLTTFASRRIRNATSDFHVLACCLREAGPRLVKDGAQKIHRLRIVGTFGGFHLPNCVESIFQDITFA
jgi:hypothetical protein